jgi:lytic murein transglycosylase
MSSSNLKGCGHLLRTAVIGAVLGLAPATALADCGKDGAGFASWLERFKAKAAAEGISKATLKSALAGVSYDRTVIHYDRNQRSFKLSFEQFYARRVGSGLIRRGQALIRQHKATFDRVEKRFGVPAAVLVSIWGLETGYGADTSGKFSIIRSVATLAYDCRRSPFFTGQLMDALRIVEAGDMTPAELRGGWAGEIGQTQFLPTPYFKYAVDFDGDGRRDLVGSVPDILASTANFLKAHGWQAGQSWEPGSANYAVIKDWNRAEVYQRTISVMASKLQQQMQASAR